jgi:hypothetical protein
MSRLGLAALAILGAGLAATVAWEIGGAPEPDAASGAVPLAWRATSTVKAAAPAAADQAGRWAATVLARPLFSPSRRPSADAVAAGDQPLKLQGTILVPPARLAIFAPPGGGKSVIVHERDRMGALGIDQILPGEVAATGPEGRVVFRLGRGSASEPPAAQPPTFLRGPGDNVPHAQ